MRGVQARSDQFTRNRRMAGGYFLIGDMVMIRVGRLVQLPMICGALFQLEMRLVFPETTMSAHRSKEPWLFVGLEET